MILPQNFRETYPCIDECGASSIIYANLDYTKAYKIYRNGFNYDEEKFNSYLEFNHPNFFFPTDIVSIENSDELIIGYEMDLDDGIALSKVIDASLSMLINESLNVPMALKELSDSHFLIVDPNVDNITFSTTFKFVDTDSYLLAMKYASEVIYGRNITKVNDTILCGLIGFSYKKTIEAYLRRINSRYLDLFEDSIKTKTRDESYIYDVLSIVQETTQEDKLNKVKKRILELTE